MGGIVGGVVTTAALVVGAGIVVMVVYQRRAGRVKERIVLLERSPLYVTHPVDVPFDPVWEFSRQRSV